MEEQLTELIQYLGHIMGGFVAFALVRFSSTSRVIATLVGAGLALFLWYLSPVFFLGITPSPDVDWFWAAFFVHGIMALTLAALGAFIFARPLKP